MAAGARLVSDGQAGSIGDRYHLCTQTTLQVELSDFYPTLQIG
jgi:hypothetical protein